MILYACQESLRTFEAEIHGKQESKGLRACAVANIHLCAVISALLSCCYRPSRCPLSRTTDALRIHRMPRGV